MTCLRRSVLYHGRCCFGSIDDKKSPGKITFSPPNDCSTEATEATEAPELDSDITQRIADDAFRLVQGGNEKVLSMSCSSEGRFGAASRTFNAFVSEVAYPTVDNIFEAPAPRVMRFVIRNSSSILYLGRLCLSLQGGSTVSTRWIGQRPVES